MVSIHNIKIRIYSEEHSKQIQDYLYSLGADWIFKVEEAKYMHTDKPYLYMENNIITFGTDENYFNTKDGLEINLFKLTKIEKIKDWG